MIELNKFDIPFIQLKIMSLIYHDFIDKCNCMELRSKLDNLMIEHKKAIYKFMDENSLSLMDSMRIINLEYRKKYKDNSSQFILLNRLLHASAFEMHFEAYLMNN